MSMTGAVIDGRYALERLLGRGGMGSVYRAVDTRSGARVAIKLSSERLGDGGLERFTREALTLERVSHEAIVRYIDHGSHDGRHYLVMDWLDGPSLREVLADGGVRPDRALVLIRRVIDALAHLDHLGVVHRDIKPANIVLCGSDAGRATVVDFGVARGGHPTLTGTGHLIGTPYYMAPEQIRSARDVDGRADVFAAGAVLYECLTGRRPFPGDDPLSFVARLAEGDAIPAAAVRPELPAAVDALTSRLLDRDVELRPRADAGLLAAVDAAAAELAGVDLPAVAVSAEPRRVRAADSTVTSARRGSPRPALRDIGDAAGAMFGRQDELAALVDALEPAAGGAVVWGLPGIGKSRLAIAACYRFVAQRPAVRAPLVLDARDAGDRDGLVRLVCHALDARAPAGDHREVLAQLGRTARARGEPVVVVEGGEAVPGLLAELVAAWRRPEVGARFLVTSRERIPLPGLTDLELGPLACDGDAGEPLAPAVSMLLDRAGLGAETLTQGQLAIAGRIARVLEGNPLAVELAAARIAVVGLRAGDTELASPLALVGGAGARAGRALLASLEGAWNLLDPIEQRALASCTVFAGSFTAAAAEAVLAGAGDDPVDLLARLRERSLLAIERGSGGAHRFRMPRAVREFAAERLVELGDAAELRDRRNRHQVDACDRLAVELDRAGSVALLMELVAEADDLRAAAADLIGRGDPDLALRAVLALDPVASLHGGLEPQLGLLTRALERAPTDPALVARGLAARGRLLGVHQRFDAAEADLAAAGEHARAAGGALAAAIELDRAVLHHHARRYRDARRLYRAALDRLATREHPRLEARALANLAAVDHDERRFDDALAGYQEAIALLDSLDDLRQLATTSANSALLFQELGDLDAAAEGYARAVDSLARLRDHRLWGIALSNFGMLELERGRPDEAVRRHQQAAQLLARAGDARSEALCAARLGAAHACAGDVAAAIVAFHRADRSCPAGDARAAVDALRGLLEVARARVAEAGGRASAAAEHLASARGRRTAAAAAAAGSDDVRTALRVLDRELAS